MAHRLNLSHNDISALGSALPQTLALPHLTDLDLGHNPLTECPLNSLNAPRLLILSLYGLSPEPCWSPLPPGALLLELHLSSSGIRALDQALLAPYTLLTLLDLSDNPLLEEVVLWPGAVLADLRLHFTGLKALPHALPHTLSTLTVNDTPLER
jgi:hypothetical protein